MRHQWNEQGGKWLVPFDPGQFHESRAQVFPLLRFSWWGVDGFRSRVTVSEMFSMIDVESE